MSSSALFDENIKGFFGSALRRSLGRGGPGAGSVRKLLGAAMFQNRQAKRRKKAQGLDRTVPAILIASITRKCNLDCTGCYAKALRPGASEELSDDRFMALFSEAIELGVGTIMLAGGEPLLRRTLLERASRLPGVLMPVFTNGLLMDKDYLELFTRGRLVPVFSIEGDAAFTAERRGTGIHEVVLEKTAELNRRGALFGFSVTVTSRNADLVLSDGFLSRIEGTGAAVLFLIEYVPVEPGTDDLAVTSEQRAVLNRLDRFPSRGFEVVALPGDEELYGGCLAAGRGFIHLADDGRIEACPFAPYSDSSAASGGLSAAIDSPLMREIRNRHGELTETRGGCALWNKQGWIASLGGCAPVREKERVR
jgi:MoaA/NifB/PqqE/SkfB family radical SAM enzyme